MRYRQDNVRQRKVIGRRQCDAGITETFKRAWESAGDKIEILRRALKRPASIAHAISRPQYGLVFSKPRKRPSDADGGGEVIPIIVIKRRVRVW